MRYKVDRFESKFAILEAENTEIIGVERARLPQETAEGDVIIHEAGEWRIDAQETARRRAQMRDRLNSLWQE